MARYVTLVVTARLADDVDVIQLADLVQLAVEDAGAEVVDVPFAPDAATVADAVGCGYDELTVLTLPR